MKILDPQFQPLPRKIQGCLVLFKMTVQFIRSHRENVSGAQSFDLAPSYEVVMFSIALFSFFIIRFFQNGRFKFGLRSISVGNKLNVLY